MDIADWRKRIDELDEKLVALINERAKAAQAIGRLKRDTNLPVYEPQREEEVFEHVRQANQGPLRDADLLQVFERLIDVMRKIQKQEIAPPSAKSAGDTELEVND